MSASVKLAIKKGCNSIKRINNYQNIYYLNDDSGVCVGITSNDHTPFLFDSADFKLICRYNWKRYCYTQSDNSPYYLISAYDKNEGTVYLHRVIFQTVSNDVIIDHINRDTSDNRKSNLRICTLLENTRNHSLRKDNSSGVTGVYWDERRKKWRACYYIGGRTKHLGYYDNFHQAVKSRLIAEKEVYGAFAPQSYLFDAYDISDVC